MIETNTVRTSTWTLAEAKAKFSEVIERVLSGAPQTITRNGHIAAVIVSAEEWERKTKCVGNLAEFFAASPLRGSDLAVKRVKDTPRRVRAAPCRSLVRWPASGAG